MTKACFGVLDRNIRTQDVLPEKMGGDGGAWESGIREYLIACGNSYGKRMISWPAGVV